MINFGEALAETRKRSGGSKAEQKSENGEGLDSMAIKKVKQKNWS